MPQQPLQSNFKAKSAVGAGRPKTITDTEYTLTLKDQGLWLRLAPGSTGSLIVPAEADVAFPVNAQITIEQSGANAIVVSGAGGVTIGSADSAFTTNGQSAVAGLVKVGSDEWVLIGNVIP